MPNFLVTGGAGFIGSNIVRALLNRGDTVRVLDNLSTGKPENLGARGTLETLMAEPGHGLLGEMC